MLFTDQDFEIINITRIECTDGMLCVHSQSLYALPDTLHMSLYIGMFTSKMAVRVLPLMMGEPPVR